MKTMGTKVQLEVGDFVLIKAVVAMGRGNFLKAIGNIDYMEELRNKEHKNLGVKTYDVDNPNFVPRFTESEIVPIDEKHAMDLLSIYADKPEQVWEFAKRFLGTAPAVEVDVPWHTESDFNETGELVQVERSPEEIAAEEALFQAEAASKSGPCVTVKAGREIIDEDCDLALPEMRQVKEEPKHEQQLGFDPSVDKPEFVELIPGVKVLLYGLTPAQKQANVGICNFVAMREGRYYWNQHLNKSMRGTTPYIRIEFALKQQEFANLEIAVNKLFQSGKVYTSCSRSEIEKLLK